MSTLTRAPTIAANYNKVEEQPIPRLIIMRTKISIQPTRANCNLIGISNSCKLHSTSHRQNSSTLDYEHPALPPPSLRNSTQWIPCCPRVKTDINNESTTQTLSAWNSSSRKYKRHMFLKSKVRRKAWKIRWHFIWRRFTKKRRKQRRRNSRKTWSGKSKWRKYIRNRGGRWKRSMASRMMMKVKTSSSCQIFQENRLCTKEGWPSWISNSRSCLKDRKVLVKRRKIHSKQKLLSAISQPRQQAQIWGSLWSFRGLRTATLFPSAPQICRIIFSKPLLLEVQSNKRIWMNSWEKKPKIWRT